MKTKCVKIGNATMYCGDCFDIMPRLDIQADAIISDPPYGVTDCDWDCSIPLEAFWAMVEERAKQSANIVLFGCGKFTVDLINSKPNWYRYDMIWVKSKKCGHLNANKMPMRNHEQILVFGRPGFRVATTYHAQKTPGGKVGVKTVNHKSSVYRDKGKFTHLSDGSLHPGSVLYFKSELDQHPTQKPVSLMECLVKSYSNENEIVVDPFMGSGSTGVACMNTGRQFIGIERERQYFNVACERIEEAYANRE